MFGRRLPIQVSECIRSYSSVPVSASFGFAGQMIDNFACETHTEGEAGRQCNGSTFDNMCARWFIMWLVSIKLHYFVSTLMGGEGGGDDEDVVERLCSSL